MFCYFSRKVIRKYSCTSNNRGLYPERCVSVLHHFSCVQLFLTPWTVALQAPLSMGFSRQEYWSGLPCPSPGDLPYPGIEPMSLMSSALADVFFTTCAIREVCQSKLFIRNFCQKNKSLFLDQVMI